MTDAPLPDRAWMTPLLNRLADVAGERAALLLGREKACQQIYIPAAHNLANDHWLVQLLGEEAARAICLHFGPRKMVIPPAIASDRRRRATAIAEMIAKGYSNNEIAAALGIARSTVNEHRLKHPSETSRQGSLF